MDIETRFESLQRKLRLHRRLWMGTACLLAGAIVLGATRPVPKVIVAENFVVMGPSGKPRASWGVSKDGEVVLGMTEGGKPRLAIGVRKGYTGMIISDSEGKRQFAAGLIKAKSQKEPFPLIALFDKTANPRSA